MPLKRKIEPMIFDEPLIQISLQPTEEIDPLFIDPNAEVDVNNEEDESILNGFSIFSPKAAINRLKSPKTPAKENNNSKENESDGDTVKIKEEPKDCANESEEEIDPLVAAALVLDQILYLCPKCVFRSPFAEEVTDHITTNHRKTPLGVPRPCDKCDYTAKSLRELANHKKVAHPRSYSHDIPTLPSGEFKCPQCEFVSFHKNYIRSHMRVHSRDTVYKCDKCPYTANNRFNIENHTARHFIKKKNKWKFKCKYCGLLERTEKLLQRHLVLHGEGDMVTCQHCTYKSPYQHIISMHTRICHGAGRRKWQKDDEPWQTKRQSTRLFSKNRKNEDDEPFQEEFLELAPKKTKRGRKKKIVVSEDIKSTNTDELAEKEEKTENDQKSPEKIEEQDPSTPRRPTLEERLGRIKQVLNSDIPLKKSKAEDVKDKISDDAEKTNSDCDEGGDKNKDKSGSEDEDICSQDENNSGEEQSDEESDRMSDFDGETAEESMQSFPSVDQNSSVKDLDDTTSDLDTMGRVEGTNPRLNGAEPSDTNKDNSPSPSNSDSINRSAEDEMEQTNERTELKSVTSDDFQDKLSEEDTQDKEEDIIASDEEAQNKETHLDKEPSAPAVIVLKRKGSSFTCVQKNNMDLS